MTPLQEHILSVIPQRPPFVMIDQLVSCNEESTCTTLLVRADNILVEDGLLSEAGLTENIAQTAAAAAGYAATLRDQPVKTGYIGAIKNLEIFALPRVGDLLETEIMVQNQIFEVTIIKGNVRHKGVTLAQCEMKIFIKN